MPKVLRSRAFDAFVPDSEPGEELTNARLLPLDVIEPNPYQARQAFEPEKLDELTASVREHGVLEPILVQAMGGDLYRILAGERRYRAATAAGLTQIPAIIREDLTEEEAAFITATENLQRADLDIEDEARQFAYLLQLTSMSQRALADKLGITFNYLSRRVRLLERPDLLAAIREGRITQRDALAQLRDPGSLITAHSPEIAIQTGGATVAPMPVPATPITSAGSEVYHRDTPSSAGTEVYQPDTPLIAGSGLYHGDTNLHVGSSTDSDIPSLVERDDLDSLTIGDVEADLGPPPQSVPRWRYVEDAQRALRRIDARTIPPGERPAWLQQVAVLEALVADLKRRLLALEGGPTDAV